jgi:hypothetical protein
MNEVMFEERLSNLDFLSGCYETTDAFTAEYERLFYEIKAHPGPRLALVAKLKMLQVKQGLYLCAMLEQARIEEDVNTPYPAGMGQDE